MSPSEQEILDRLTSSQQTLAEAKRKIAEVKRAWNEAETALVNAKVQVERMTEELRVFRRKQVVPGEDYDLYDDEG